MKSDSANDRDWFFKAEKDLSAIRGLLKDSEAHWETIAFLSQQAAEKFLKGFISANIKQPPKIHDLVKLLELCLPLDKTLSRFQIDCRRLNGFYISSRYPLMPEPTEREARACVEVANQIRAAVRKHFPEP